MRPFNPLQIRHPIQKIYQGDEDHGFAVQCSRKRQRDQNARTPGHGRIEGNAKTGKLQYRSWLEIIIPVGKWKKKDDEKAASERYARGERSRERTVGKKKQGNNRDPADCG